MIRWLVLKFYDSLPVSIQFEVGLHFSKKYGEALARMHLGQIRGRTAELYFHRALRARENGLHPERHR